MPTLEVLAMDAAESALSVPDWTLGCFIRRSIAYATGATDTATKVVWVQAHGMTGDLRIPPGRPRVAADDRIEDMDAATLAALASVEGAAGETSWNAAESLMSWRWRWSYQPYDKWDEPAELKRIGPSLIEFAPSGIYVEDWRHQPSGGGALAGLELIAEGDAAGEMRPRGGGLVVAGDNALQCLARRDELPEGVRAQDFVREAADPVAAYRQAADCVTDFATKGRIAASTDPWREGAPFDLDGFEPEGEGVLRQRADGVERLWRIRSFGRRAAFPAATEARPDKLAWLAREADTLLQGEGAATCV